MRNKPVTVALVGTGRRAWAVYFEILPKLKDFFQLVAVCDPLRQCVDEAAAKSGVRAFYSLRERLGADPMDVEAMLDVTFPKNFVESVWVPGKPTGNCKQYKKRTDFYLI